MSAIGFFYFFFFHYDSLISRYTKRAVPIKSINEMSINIFYYINRDRCLVIYYTHHVSKEKNARVRCILWHVNFVWSNKKEKKLPTELRKPCIAKKTTVFASRTWRKLYPVERKKKSILLCLEVEKKIYKEEQKKKKKSCFLQFLRASLNHYAIF